MSHPVPVDYQPDFRRHGSCRLRFGVRIASTMLGLLLLSTVVVAQPRWERMTSAILGADVRAFAFDSAGVPYVATDAGLYRLDATDHIWQPLGHIQLSTIAIAPNGLMIGTTAERLVRSTDGGQTWSQSRNWAMGGRVVYAPNGKVYGLLPASILRSDDSGSSWKTLSTTSHSYTFGIAADGTLVRSDRLQVRRSTSNGDSWQWIVNTGPFGKFVLASNGDLLTTSGGSLVRSVDNGLTWIPGDDLDLESIIGAIDGVIYAVRNPGAGKQLVRSPDDGASWSVIGDNVPDLIEVAPNGDLWIAQNDSIRTSTDGGATWIDVHQFDMGYPPIGAIAESPDGTLVASASGLLLRSSDNGESWLVSGTTPGSELAGIDSSGDIYFSRTWNELTIYGDETTFGSLMRSRPDSIAWRGVPGNTSFRTLSLDHPTVLAAAFSEYGVWGSSFYGGVSVSRDGGESWDITSIDLAAKLVVVTHAGTVLTSIYEYGCMPYQAGLYVLRHPDTAWVQRFDSLQVEFLEVAPNGNIYLAGRWHLIDSITHYPTEIPVFLRSSDDGHTWQSILDSGQVSRLYITRTGDLHLWVTDNSYPRTGKALFSNDNGESWKRVSSAPSGSAPVFLETLPDGALVMTDDSTLYRSDDHGETWRSIHFNLPVAAISAAVVSRSGYLFVGTGRGIYRMPLRAAAVEEIVASRSLDVSIESPRPNPLVASSIVPLVLGSSRHLRVTLCDLRGTELRLVHDGILPAGVSDLTIERGDLPGGNYILLVRSAEGVVSRTLTMW